MGVQLFDRTSSQSHTLAGREVRAGGEPDCGGNLRAGRHPCPARCFGPDVRGAGGDQSPDILPNVNEFCQHVGKFGPFSVISALMLTSKCSFLDLQKHLAECSTISHSVNFDKCWQILQCVAEILLKLLSF